MHASTEALADLKSGQLGFGDKFSREGQCILPLSSARRLLTGVWTKFLSVSDCVRRSNHGNYFPAVVWRSGGFASVHNADGRVRQF
jgi:hypothetical protein